MKYKTNAQELESLTTKLLQKKPSDRFKKKQKMPMKMYKGMKAKALKKW